MPSVIFIVYGKSTKGHSDHYLNFFFFKLFKYFYVNSRFLDDIFGRKQFSTFFCVCNRKPLFRHMIRTSNHIWNFGKVVFVRKCRHEMGRSPHKLIFLPNSIKIYFSLCVCVCDLGCFRWLLINKLIFGIYLPNITSERVWPSCESALKWFAVCCFQLCVYVCETIQFRFNHIIALIRKYAKPTQ